MAPRQALGPRFEDLTETTGIPVSAEGASMMYTRYRVAADVASGRRVLELGCGSGQGFGLMHRARSIIGGDYSMALLRSARRHYGSGQPLVRLSANALPFRAASFDLVLFYEASYYVPDMAAAFGDIARVLASSGTVLFVNANPERPDFIASPHSVHYHSADEFRSALEAQGLGVTIEGAFPVDPPATGAAARAKGLVTGLARRILEGLGLVPKTLRGRAKLKRLMYGKLLEVPSQLPEGFAPVEPRGAVAPGRTGGFKVLYVSGRKPSR